jgi:hypothetical protein
VDHFLLLALLPFQCLLTESLHGDQLLATPLFSGVISVSSPLCCVQFFFFFAGDGQSAQGAMLIYPRDGWGNTS